MQGTNSTGLYTNGASPTTPATTLGGNVNLHSGDVFNVHLTYNGTINRDGIGGYWGEHDLAFNAATMKAGTNVLALTVPADTSVDLHGINGALSVDGVHGEVDTDTLNGRTELNGISGTVVAHSLNGPIHVIMDRVDSSKPLSFSSLNGAIDVTLPADIKADVKFKTMHADIYSDFEIALGGPAAMEKDGSGGLKFRLRFDNNFEGVINGGGVEASFHTLHGTIYLRKKK